MESLDYQREYRMRPGRKRPPRRVQFLDETRGFCVLLMVAYHAAYDMVALFEVNIPAFHSPLLQFLQPLVAGIFVLISGIACRYSRNNLKRGAIALGLGLALTAFTLYFMKEQAIYFGILHLLGVSMMLFALLQELLDSLPPLVGAVLCGLLFLLLWGVPQGWLGLGPAISVELPRGMYGTSFLFPVGLPGPGFSSSDYFPLVPWLFLFLAGSYIGVLFVENKMNAFFYNVHIPLLAAVGRKALWVYLLHQPVVYGVLWGVFRLLSLLGWR